MAKNEKTTKNRRRRGEGSFYYDEARRKWTAQVELPRDALNDKRRRVTVREDTEKALVKEVDRLKAGLRKSGDLPTGSTSTAVYMRYWFEKVNKSRPMTRAAYRSSIEQYIIPAVGRVRIDRLTPNDVRRVEDYIVEQKGLSPTTALQAYRVLSKALKDAEREGRVSQNVARLIDPPRRAVTKMKVLTVEEAIAVIGSVTEDRLGSRYAAALLTGARQGELLGLEIDRVGTMLDLSWQLQRIPWRHGCENTCNRKRGTDCPKRRLDAPADWEHRHLTGGLYLARPKSRAGWRMVPLVDPLRSIIERRLEESKDEPNPYGLVWTADPKMTKHTHQLLPLDGSPVDPSWDNRKWHSILDRAGVPDMRLHDARHTAVTMLFELGIAEVVIQDIVGQSTVATTRSYRHKSTPMLYDALGKLGGALTPPTARAALEPASQLELAETP